MRTFSVTDDIYGIDCELFETEALSAFVIDDDEPTLVETGFANGTETLVSGLTDIGVEPSDLSNAIVSHVHLDHSGGAAALLEWAPDLDVYIHEATASLLVDPTRLVESSKQAMGEAFDAVGAPDPLPEENIVPVDSSTGPLDIGTHSLEFRHTPGHSPDHLAVWSPSAGVLFANEALGSYYPKADAWLPPGTFPQFDVEAVSETIESLRQLEPDRIAMSHYGVRTDPKIAFDTASDQLQRFSTDIPAMYDEYGSVEETEQAVRSELLGLDDGYGDGLTLFETHFQTRGFLKATGKID